MVSKTRSCVFISGNGSNLKSIIKSSRDYYFPIKIQLIISDNINAKGLDFAKKFLLSHKTLMAVDESTTIKNPKAKRTKNIIQIADMAKYAGQIPAIEQLKSDRDDFINIIKSFHKIEQQVFI